MFRAFAQDRILKNSVHTDGKIIYTNDNSCTSFALPIQTNFSASTYLKNKKNGDSIPVKVSQIVKIKKYIDDVQDSAGVKKTETWKGEVLSIDGGKFECYRHRPFMNNGDTVTVLFSEIKSIKLLNGTNRALGGLLKFVGGTAAVLGPLIGFGLIDASLASESVGFFAGGAGGVALWFVGRKMNNSKKCRLGKTWNLIQQ